MFNQYNELNNYMTYDSGSLNQYNYKHLGATFPIYQEHQNFYYYTRQINPITLSNVSPQTRDPTNLPCDIRPTIYDGVDVVYGHNLMNGITHLQTPQNNPNNWRDNIQPKQGYHNQYEHTLNNIRLISAIQAGESSNQDAYLLFRKN